MKIFHNGKQAGYCFWADKELGFFERERQAQTREREARKAVLDGQREIGVGDRRNKACVGEFKSKFVKIIKEVVKKKD